MRATLDKLISWTGLLLAAVLLVAGGLLTWANTFIGDEVYKQLSMQDITMPEKDALETKAQHDALDKYAGEKLTTGPQAKAYAEHYILVHMNASSDGRSYSQVSNELRALGPEGADTAEGQELAGLKASLFQGNTLRGLLLYGYAFATMGTIAGIAAIASFVAAGLMLILSVFGLVHAKRARETAEPQERVLAHS
jgi:hypothetical protein